MGRWSTGALNTDQVLRLEIDFLLKNGYLKRGCEIHGTISWTSGARIGFESHLKNKPYFVRLYYTLTDNSTSQKHQLDYKVYVDSIASNLGKGEILYFVCPVSGQRAKKLYSCYNSRHFKCRVAYQHRIYYPTQQCSKLDFHNVRYWQLKREVDSLYKRSKTGKYNGKTTKNRARLNKLTKQLDYHDKMRWQILPKKLKGLLPLYGLGNYQ